MPRSAEFNPFASGQTAVSSRYVNKPKGNRRYRRADRYEFSAELQYYVIAAHFTAEALPQLSQFFPNPASESSSVVNGS